MRILALSILLAGCASVRDPAGSDDTEAAADSDAAADTEVEDPAPSIVLADAWCYLHDTGVENWRWNVAAAGEDAQGSIDLKSFGHEVVIRRGGGTLATYPLSCQQDGDCTTSFLEAEYGVLCAQAAATTFTIRLEDQEGNWSEPVEITGREGTNPEG